jgi:hypothetical protein
MTEEPICSVWPQSISGMGSDMLSRGSTTVLADVEVV